jgi:hypothetical protein
MGNRRILNKAKPKALPVYEWNKLTDVMGILYVSEIKSWLSHTGIRSRKTIRNTWPPYCSWNCKHCARNWFEGSVCISGSALSKYTSSAAQILLLPLAEVCQMDFILTWLISKSASFIRVPLSRLYRHRRARKMPEIIRRSMLLGVHVQAYVDCWLATNMEWVQQVQEHTECKNRPHRLQITVSILPGAELINRTL